MMNAFFSTLKGSGLFVRDTARELIEDDALTLAASLAFYTSLSLSPLLIILTWMVGALGESYQNRVVESFVVIVGPRAGEALRLIMESAQSRPSLANIAGLTSLGMLLLSAAAVFGHLQHSLNLIWDTRGSSGGGIGAWLRKRLVSMGMVFSLGFIILVSLAASTILAALVSNLPPRLQPAEAVWTTLDVSISFVMIGAMFAVIFRYLPDVTLRWRDVFFGAGVTTLLFLIGKTLIAEYIGRGSVGSAYGAAGSLLALLVWMYYSAIILFIGAEITQVWVRRRNLSHGLAKETEDRPHEDRSRGAPSLGHTSL